MRVSHQDLRMRYSCWIMGMAVPRLRRVVFPMYVVSNDPVLSPSSTMREFGI